MTTFISIPVRIYELRQIKKPYGYRQIVRSHREEHSMKFHALKLLIDLSLNEDGNGLNIWESSFYLSSINILIYARSKRFHSIKYCEPLVAICINVVYGRGTSNHWPTHRVECGLTFAIKNIYLIYILVLYNYSKTHSLIFDAHICTWNLVTYTKHKE